MSDVNTRRDFLKKALISGLGVALAPQLLGKASPLVRMVGGQSVPKPFEYGGLKLGGYYFDEEAWIRRTEEIDFEHMMKSGNPDWYGSQVVNPYHRPNNVSDWEYVGSMKLNGIPLQPGDFGAVQKSQHPFILDLDGDGEVLSSDLSILKNVRENRLDYSPSDWNSLKTVQERINWFENMVRNYDDTIQGGTVNGQNFTCGEYALKKMLRFAGLENYDGYRSISYISQLLDLEKENGKINLPLYVAHTDAKDGKGGVIPHAINAFLVGSDDLSKDTPKLLDSWYFDEPQLAKRVYPGDVSIDENSSIFIDRLAYAYHRIKDEITFRDIPFAEFIPKGNGEYSLKWIHPDAVTERPDASTGIVLPQGYGSEFEITNLYPNQISKGGSFNLEFDLQNHYGKDVDVLVRDILGRDVRKYDLGNFNYGENNVEVNTSRMNLSAGQYLVQLLSDGKASKAKRLFVQ